MTNKEKIIAMFACLDRIENINRGGCLFAAYAVFLKAKELGIKGVSLVQVNFYYDLIPTNKAFLKGDVDVPVFGNHYVLKIDGDTIDSEGIQDYSYHKTFNIRKHSDIEKLCVTSLKMRDQWCHYFDRVSGVTAIKEILGVDLSHCL